MYWIHILWMFLGSKYVGEILYNFYGINNTDLNANYILCINLLGLLAWTSFLVFYVMKRNNSNKHITLLHGHWFCLHLIVCSKQFCSRFWITCASASMKAGSGWKYMSSMKSSAKSVRKQVDIALILSASNQVSQSMLWIFWTQT